MATRGVKITGLNQLGGNLDANTILVTVDPNLDLTLQANVQSLGNMNGTTDYLEGYAIVSSNVNTYSNSVGTYFQAYMVRGV